MEDQSKSKLLALYNFIYKLNEMRFKAVKDIKQQNRYLFVKDIPISDYVKLNKHPLDTIRTEEDPLLFSIKKPAFSSCPEPPAEIENWITPEIGWGNYEISVSHKERITIKTEKYNSQAYEIEHEAFEDSDDRIIAYDHWIRARDEWVESQRINKKLLDQFTLLYNIRADLERESETLEFLAGNGIISDNNDPEINHPILTKRVRISFGAEDNQINIYDTDTDLELYSFLLQKMDDINYPAIQASQNELKDKGCHPFDPDSESFLKCFIHNISSDSAYIGINSDENQDARLKIRWEPVFFVRKRIDGTLKAIQSIIDNIEETSFAPNHIMELIGNQNKKTTTEESPESLEIDDLLSVVSGESKDILLTKEANREQLKIARRIEKLNAVLVQGPPGTGKTHTIANLMGHFMSEGKRVLVTSQKRKALSVLKEMLPDELQNLCVSILDDSKKDMNKSIDGIIEYISSPGHSDIDLVRRIRKESQDRERIFADLAEVRKKLYKIKCSEINSFDYNGQAYSPAEIGRFVRDGKGSLDYIPGNVKKSDVLPLSKEEIKELYKTNSEISKEEESELHYGLLDSANLISVEDFNKYLSLKESIESKAQKLSEMLSDNPDMIFNGRSVNIVGRSQPLITYSDSSDFKSLYNFDLNIPDHKWVVRLIIDGKRGAGYRKIWEDLFQQARKTKDFATKNASVLISNDFKINGALIGSSFDSDMRDIEMRLKQKGTISRFDFLRHKGWKEIFRKIAINGTSVIDSHDYKTALVYLKLYSLRKTLSKIWDGIMIGYGENPFDQLGETPEETVLNIISGSKKYLDWYKNIYEDLINKARVTGIHINMLFGPLPVDEEARAVEIIDTLRKSFNLVVNIACDVWEYNQLNDHKNSTMKLLQSKLTHAADIYGPMLESLKSDDTKQYDIASAKYTKVSSKAAILFRRDELLERLREAAPEWESQIKQRNGEYGSSDCFERIEEAWQWKQFSMILEDLLSQSYEELQEKAIERGQALRRVTKRVVVAKAWYSLINYMKGHPDVWQELQGWKLTNNKIGKGKGKKIAPRMRAEAIKLMPRCQDAVPAWVMPLTTAMDTFDPSKNRFDVLIIDEASQSDISALAILYIADKVIIVGDDKQVSPMAIGKNDDEIVALQQMYIKGKIPNWHVYDTTTSLFDIAGTTYDPLMLREHFRCVSEIIGFSNMLSYDWKIKPLRDGSDCRTVPPIVSYRAKDGERRGKDKINVNEAKSIVALIYACIEQPEYEDKTFGVISLLGSEQAYLIQEMIQNRIEQKYVEEREILCGDASNFQGDERDIIFISLVDSNLSDGPLNKVTEGPGRSTQQRYNVAVSRAKDQLWVVHSLDYQNDLKSDDMRRRLLEYAEDPHSFTNIMSEVSKKADSPFEESVAGKLISEGYNVIQQWSVGSYRIDMVVKCNDKKVAIECDGERYHSGEEKVREDIERQSILERAGWRFIRIRGSEYYSDSEATMKRVINEIKAYDIYPEAALSEKTSTEEPEILIRVKRRAREILDAWNDDDSYERIETRNNLKKSKGHIKSDIIKQKDKNNKKSVSGKKGAKNKLEKIEYSKIDLIEWSNIAGRHGEKTENGSVLKKDNNRIKPPKERKTTEKKKVEHTDQLTFSDSRISKSEVGKNRSKSKNKGDNAGEDLIKLLSDNNINYIDKRSESDIVWVPVTSDTKNDAEIVISKTSYKYEFEHRGAIATDNKPAIRIMVKL